MPTTIYKYPIHGWTFENFELTMPVGSKILSFQMQDTIPTIWAWVDLINPMINRKFIVFGTGDEIPRGNYDYIGTAIAGVYVLHLFEILK